MMSQVYASDQWLCKEASSERNGMQISSCGIGYGRNENEARLSAFENAKKEFTAICSSDTDCGNREISVSPARTSCEVSMNGYQCYRMIVFTLGDIREPQEEPSMEDLEEATPPPPPDLSANRNTPPPPDQF